MKLVHVFPPQESEFEVALIAFSIPNSPKIIKTGKHYLKLIFLSITCSQHCWNP